jgi:hypothetical protein
LAARSNRKSNREALHHCGTLLAGIKIATVARQLGVSRSWASREANAAGTRILVAELLDSQGERLSELFDQTLNVIEDAPSRRLSLQRALPHCRCGGIFQHRMRS